MLDVGCGWGSFAIHAARRHGVQVLGVTLSAPQVELAQERARAAGVEDLVEFRVADYRELGDGQFDAISSIGMVEHVGEERIDLYARTLAGLLRPGGRLLNHGIAKLQDFDDPRRGRVLGAVRVPRWGAAAAVAGVAGARADRAGRPRHVEGLQNDYARDDAASGSRGSRSATTDAVRLAGVERARVWRLYLRAAHQGFATGWASVYQVLAHKP